MRHPYTHAHYPVILSADRPDLPVRVFRHDPHAACKDCGSVTVSGFCIPRMYEHVHIFTYIWSFWALGEFRWQVAFWVSFKADLYVFFNFIFEIIYSYTLIIFTDSLGQGLAHLCSLVRQPGYTASEGLVDYVADFRLRPEGGRFRSSIRTILLCIFVLNWNSNRKYHILCIHDVI